MSPSKSNVKCALLDDGSGLGLSLKQIVPHRVRLWKNSPQKEHFILKVSLNNESYYAFVTRGGEFHASYDGMSPMSVAGVPV